MTGISILERRLARLFDEGRRYVQHEDDLVDRRLKWIITISGFLFAAYGGSLIATANVKENASQMMLLSGARIGMGIAGVISCIIGASSINAAHRAIKAIARKYTAFVIANAKGIEEEKLQAWQLIGDRPSKLPGFSSSIFMPYLIANVWFALLLLEVALVMRNEVILAEIRTLSSGEQDEFVNFICLFIIFLSSTAFAVYHSMNGLKADGAQDKGNVAKGVEEFKSISDASFKRKLPVANLGNSSKTPKG